MAFLWNSVKGYLGYENLETESAGTDTPQVVNHDSEERKGLFKQLSSYVGKDITSMISLPVWVFEPLSFLQIMCEPMQYAELLNKASESSDSINRMAYLIAFVTSGYSCAVRQKKPFNPILGETFEYVDLNKKWKFFAEQVSHHPPIGVAVAEGDGFTLLLEMELKTKFRGNSSDVFVSGATSLNFHKWGDEFTWGHLDTCAHNVIVGWMWVDHYGTLEFKNKTTGDKAVITFNKCGWLGAGRFELSGDIMDKDGKVRMKIKGKWNEVVYGIKIDSNGNEGSPIVIWKKPIKEPDNKWGWSWFTQNMNSMSDAYKSILPQTDSRLRTDRYYLERDDLETAGAEKHKLEEKQRAERKEREEKGEEWKPKYFKKVEDAEHGSKHVYFGKYWEEREERLKAAGLKDDITQLTKAVEEVNITAQEENKEEKQ